MWSVPRGCANIFSAATSLGAWIEFLRNIAVWGIELHRKQPALRSGGNRACVAQYRGFRASFLFSHSCIYEHRYYIWKGGNTKTNWELYDPVVRHCDCYKLEAILPWGTHRPFRNPERKRSADTSYKNGVSFTIFASGRGGRARMTACVCGKMAEARDANAGDTGKPILGRAAPLGLCIL